MPGKWTLPAASRNELDLIHEQVIRVLEKIGLADAIPSCIEVTAQGCTMTESGRLLIPRKVIEETLKSSKGDDALWSDSGARHAAFGSRTLFGTARTSSYRGTSNQTCDPVKDLYDLARLCDKLEHIHFFQRPIVCHDLDDPREMDFNTCLALVFGTKKHVGTGFVEPGHVEEA